MTEPAVSIKGSNLPEIMHSIKTGGVEPLSYTTLSDKKTQNAQ